MTDTRKEFEETMRAKDYGFSNFIMTNGKYNWPMTEEFYQVWQACQQLNDKRIADLLAVIAKKDEALQEVINVFETTDHPGICDTVWVTGTRPETLYECAQEAIAITADGVELVEVGYVDQFGNYEHNVKPYQWTQGDSVYTIKQKG